MKKHLIQITEKENDKLQEIKKDFRLNNINETIQKLIKYYRKKDE